MSNNHEKIKELDPLPGSLLADLVEQLNQACNEYGRLDTLLAQQTAEYERLKATGRNWTLESTSKEIATMAAARAAYPIYEEIVAEITAQWKAANQKVNHLEDLISKRLHAMEEARVTFLRVRDQMKQAEEGYGRYSVASLYNLLNDSRATVNTLYQEAVGRPFIIPT